MKKILLAALFFLLSSQIVRADFSSIEIVNTYNLADKNAVDGDIIANSANGLVRSKIAYDQHLFGVVSLSPDVVYRSEDKAELPVSRSGITQVNVTNLGGAIKSGDLITSSAIAGKGQKANNSGYVIGSALSAFSGSEGTNVSFGGKNYKQGKITVAMRIEYADINSPQTFKRLFDLVGNNFFSSVADPDKFGLLIRYIAGGLAVVVALLIAFLTFSRSIPKAVEAIGRNPLAKTSIYVSLIISAIVMIVVIALGVIAAFIVIKL